MKGKSWLLINYLDIKHKCVIIHMQLKKLIVILKLISICKAFDLKEEK